MPNYAKPTSFMSDWERSVLDDPDAAYARFWESQPNRDSGLFEDFFGRQRKRYYDYYLSEMARQPTLSFLDYLTNSVDPYKEYSALSPEGRRENPSKYVGRTRFLGL